jgi:transcriptional regulator with XRE-family HTH domain
MFPLRCLAAFRDALSTLCWSQRTLAQRLGVSHQTVNRYADGSRTIPADVACWLEELANFVAANPPPERRAPAQVVIEAPWYRGTD